MHLLARRFGIRLWRLFQNGFKDQLLVFQTENFGADIMLQRQPALDLGHSLYVLGRRAIALVRQFLAASEFSLAAL